MGRPRDGDANCHPGVHALVNESKGERDERREARGVREERLGERGGGEWAEG